MVDENLAHLLKRFPVYWQQALIDVEDDLEPSSSGNFDTVNRHGQGGHSDPTGDKALRLVDLSDLIDKLKKIRQWIDQELHPEDRALLVAMWRVGVYGWRVVARELRWEVQTCVLRWESLLTSLSGWMTPGNAD